MNRKNTSEVPMKPRYKKDTIHMNVLTAMIKMNLIYEKFSFLSNKRARVGQNQVKLECYQNKENSLGGFASEYSS